MSAEPSKRQRAKKACVPCHQRKRKCDGACPCSTCTTYEYDCRYVDEESNATVDGNGYGPSPAKRRVNGDHYPASMLVSSTTSPGHQSHVSPHSGSGGSVSTTPNVVAPGVFDEQKVRYAGASAAMAFPYVLGNDLGAQKQPKMHSVAYNFGVRAEELSRAHGSLDQLVTEYGLTLFSGVFFSAIAPIMDIVDSRIYAQRCREYYLQISNSTPTAPAFGAIAAGVAALGSFLSRDGHPKESELVHYAKSILDDPASTRVLGVDHIVAWGLRVLYLRATTRPDSAWIASCTALHLCETIGLHEEETIQKISSLPGAATIGHDAERLRRIFWVAWAGHIMTSYEHDRSPVQFRQITCKPIAQTPGSLAHEFVQYISIIPSPNSPFRLEDQPVTAREDLIARLRVVHQLKSKVPFMVVTRADLAFCFFRRIYQLRSGIPDEILQLIVECGDDAVGAAEELARDGRLFWNVIGSVFQYVCVLLSVERSWATKHVAGALSGLETLVKVADTPITRKALSTARHLLGLKIAKKREELAQLEAVDTGSGIAGAPMEVDTTFANGSSDWNFDWDQFLLDPYLFVPGQEITFS